MKVIETEIYTKELLTKSNLPASDYVINPYTGCPHACKYCYACFMKRFTGHLEKWGEFIDIKRCSKPININKLYHKSVFLSSVTDCYNPYEEKYKLMPSILEQLKYADCSITISTKSDLILRDIDLLKQLRDLKVAVSINTLDDNFQKDMDHASSLSQRLNTLKQLYEQGIYTILFMSPIFPYITDFKSIIQETSAYIKEYWFENLNLRGDYKQEILSYICEKYPQYLNYYKQIYLKKDNSYWDMLSNEISEFCESNNIQYANYFHHSQLVSEKKQTDNI